MRARLFGRYRHRQVADIIAWFIKKDLVMDIENFVPKHRHHHGAESKKELYSLWIAHPEDIHPIDWVFNFSSEELWMECILRFNLATTELPKPISEISKVFR